MDSLRLKSPTKFAALMGTVLSRVTPSETEEAAMRAGISTVIGRLSKIVGSRAELIVAGSSARGTNISGDSDVDIFMLFDKSVGKDSMEHEAVNAAKLFVKGMKGESYVVKYAEHPYARLLLGDLGINVDLVPAYKISSTDEMGTSVDRTQLHNEFVNAHMTTAQKGDVRVLKALLKEHFIYGAESKTEGFSGYLCELLVLHYGSLLEVLERMSSAKMPLAIQPGRDARESADALAKRFGKAFVVVDPIDAGRNVAANVSEESLARLAIVARTLLDKPSESTFYSKGHSDANPQRSIADLRKRLGISMHAISMEFKDVSDEIIWQQVKKLERRVAASLSSNGTTVLLSLSNVSDGHAMACFFVGTAHNRFKVVSGPSAFMGSAADSFIRAHSDAIFLSLDNDKLFAVHPYDSKSEGIIKDVIADKTGLPSQMKKNSIKVYSDAHIPVDVARMIYASYSKKVSI